MVWVGRPFHPDMYWWTLTLDRSNRQRCHSHENKNKKSSFSFFSRVDTVSLSILEPTLRAHIATACSTATALPRPPRHGRNAVPCCTAPERRRLLSYLSTATHHSSPSSFEPMRHGPRRRLRRDVLHHA
jgi:hypothetical protein